MHMHMRAKPLRSRQFRRRNHCLLSPMLTIKGKVGNRLASLSVEKVLMRANPFRTRHQGKNKEKERKKERKKRNRKEVIRSHHQEEEQRERKKERK